MMCTQSILVYYRDLAHMRDRPGLHQTGLARPPPEPADATPCIALNPNRPGFCRRKKTEKAKKTKEKNERTRWGGEAVRRCEPTTPDDLIAAQRPRHFLLHFPLLYLRFLYHCQASRGLRYSQHHDAADGVVLWRPGAA